MSSRTLATRTLHLLSLVRKYIKRPNGSRRNLVQTEVDLINSLVLPHMYVKFTGDGYIDVFIFSETGRAYVDGVTRSYRPPPMAELRYQAREIFEAAGNGTFIITKSRMRQEGLRVNGEGHEQQSEQQTDHPH